MSIGDWNCGNITSGMPNQQPYYRIDDKSIIGGVADNNSIITAKDIGRYTVNNSDTIKNSQDAVRIGATEWNVREIQGACVMSLDVPGIDPESIKITLQRAKITVVHPHRELDGHTVTRKAHVPSGYDATKIRASYELGALHLVVPALNVECTEIPLTIKK